MGSCTRGIERGLLRSGGGGDLGRGLGTPGLTFFPTVSRPSRATFVCCIFCGGWNCRWFMLLGSGPEGGTCKGQNHKGGQVARVRQQDGGKAGRGPCSLNRPSPRMRPPPAPLKSRHAPHFPAPGPSPLHPGVLPPSTQGSFLCISKYPDSSHIALPGSNGTGSKKPPRLLLSECPLL